MGNTLKLFYKKWLLNNHRNKTQCSFSRILHAQEELPLLLCLSFIQLMLLKPDYKFKAKSEELEVNNIMVFQVLSRQFLLMKELLLSIKVSELHGWEKHHTHHLELVFMSQLRNGQVLIKKEQDFHKNSQLVQSLEQSDQQQETHLMYWRQEWWLTNQLRIHL